MLALGNSVRGLRPKHKQMLYCACVLPIATYGSRLWLYEGAVLRKMQRHACLWITGAFKTSPIGAAETLAGVPPIHLHVKKLVERSHVCTHALQASHAFRRLVNGDHKFSVETLKGQIWGDLKSPITEAWLNLDLSSLDLDPVNRFNQPGLRPRDLYHGRIVYDIVSALPKTDKDHKKYMADRINLLRGSVNAASHSPQRICIVTDTSTPPLPLQSVVAFCLWHEGDLYDNWSAAGRSTSDNAELRAIADGVRQAYNVGLEDVRQVHVFSDSANALRLTMDVLTYSSLPGDAQLVVDFGVSGFPLYYLEVFQICKDDPNELRCALDVSYKGNWGMRTTSSRPSAAGLVVFESGRQCFASC
jgi:hypothetical protein